MKVSVPQQDGEIILTGLSGPTTYTVKDGVVDVSDSDLDGFLLVVEGANPAPTKATAATPPKES